MIPQTPNFLEFLISVGFKELPVPKGEYFYEFNTPELRVYYSPFYQLLKFEPRFTSKHFSDVPKNLKLNRQLFEEANFLTDSWFWSHFVTFKSPSNHICAVFKSPYQEETILPTCFRQYPRVLVHNWKELHLYFSQKSLKHKRCAFFRKSLPS